MSGRYVRLIGAALSLIAFSGTVAGCGWLHSSVGPELPDSERLTVEIVDFVMEIQITRLSSIKTVQFKLSDEEEMRLIDQEVQQIRNAARGMFYDKLHEGNRLNVKPLTDRRADGQAERNGQGASMQGVRCDAGTDLIVTGKVVDYGKVRWQWMLAGMLGDITWETLALGLATAWNPAVIAGNIGFELLTSAPVWFGGGYLFGVAFRPVRVEAQAIECVSGEIVWSETAVATFAWRDLNQVPEEDRAKKETHLRINLQKAVEELAVALLGSGLTKQVLRERRLPALPGINE